MMPGGQLDRRWTALARDTHLSSGRTRVGGKRCEVVFMNLVERNEILRKQTAQFKRTFSRLSP